MTYEINHTFLPETIELAEEYKLIAVNERKYYGYFISYVRRTFHLSSDLSHYVHETKDDYFISLSKVAREDKRCFPALVRSLIYKYYYDELIKPHTNKPISYFVGTINVQKPTEVLFQGLSKNNSNQHFKNTENIMDTLDKYKDQVKAEVTLIHGKPVELYTESELITLIRAAKIKQQDIADLVETSSRMKTKHEQLEKDIAVYVTALDSLK